MYITRVILVPLCSRRENYYMKSKKIVGLKELRENMQTYITKVQNGEQITVFRRSTPLFTINPIDSEESGWETVIDFTEIDKEGISAKDILKLLKHTYGESKKVPAADATSGKK